MPVYARQMAYPAAFLQPTAAAAMHCHPEGCTHTPPTIPPFLQAKSLPSKQITPADNM